MSVSSHGLDICERRTVKEQSMALPGNNLILKQSFLPVSIRASPSQRSIALKKKKKKVNLQVKYLNSKIGHTFPKRVHFVSFIELRFFNIYYYHLEVICSVDLFI